ncbi:MAG: UDP-N-acetylmuramoyl-L-alanine--D-glutamate ligase [Anaerolineales bacterium]
MRDWRGRRAAVLGLARQGKALARFLESHGAEVVLSDIKPASELQSELEELEDLSLKYALGGHPETILEGTDTLFLSGGVPADLEIVDKARKAGIAIANDAQLFLELAPAKVIGITGSAGKTTTTSLVAEIARAGLENSGRKVWLGGNIGFPLINSLDEMQEGDIAVMELSSFQLEVMTRSPEIAALLNLTPDHLDRHGDMQSYRAAKARILEFQTKEDAALLNCSNPMTWEMRSLVQGQLYAFGQDLPEGIEGGFFQADKLKLRFGGQELTVCSKADIRMPGRHNQLNVLAASVLCAIAELPVEGIQEVVRRFRGVPHRLEHVRNVGGVDWYNDSIATTPDRASAAIEAFDAPIVLLAGGRDKDLDWGRFSGVVKDRVKVIILFGEAAGKIERALSLEELEGTGLVVKRAGNLQSAVEAAASIAQAGDIVLLSPGATSFDEFENYEVRGEEFRRLVEAI